MVTSAKAASRGSDAVTQGFRVEVRPSFLRDQSDESAGRWVFAYHVRIANQSEEPATLVSRRWWIVDADGEGHEVRGSGVVGQQPRIAPGATHEYSSFCPLPTPWGTMEGEYLMRRESGDEFRVRIARFYLVAPGA